MLDVQKTQMIKNMLQRAFSLPMRKSTVRQIQNGLMQICSGNTDLVNKVLASLLLGKLEKEVVEEKGEAAFKELFELFTIQIRLAKEVNEKGDFINIITSDAVKQEKDLLFMNTIRKVDGEEFQFITDLPSMLHLVGHLCNRMLDAGKEGEDKKALEPYQNELKALATSIATQKTPQPQ